MALTWVRGAVRIASRHEWLRGHPLGCIAPEDFAARLPSWSGDLWLGWGFDWLPVHTQLALDLMRAGPEQFAPRDPQRMGATWLHGLGGRDQDLRIPLAHTDGHLLIVGITGAGKTRTFDLLVTQAVLRGEAVVIIDPKGDQDLRRHRASGPAPWPAPPSASSISTRPFPPSRCASTRCTASTGPPSWRAAWPP